MLRLFQRCGGRGLCNQETSSPIFYIFSVQTDLANIMLKSTTLRRIAAPNKGHPPSASLMDIVGFGQVPVYFWVLNTPNCILSSDGRCTCAANSFLPPIR